MFARIRVTDLSPAEVRDLIARGEALLVDVREEAEFAEQRIDGAVNMPLSRFDPVALTEVDGRVVLQCGSGKRSRMAAEQCQKAGVPVERHLAGGIMAWSAAGLPTVR